MVECSILDLGVTGSSLTGCTVEECSGSVLDSPAAFAGPRSAVGNVSGYRCVSDCRSRGREFDPGPVPLLSWRLIMK